MREINSRDARWLQFQRKLISQRRLRRRAETNQSQMKYDALVMAKGKLKGKKSSTWASRHVRAR
jgi:hypothetical protein